MIIQRGKDEGWLHLDVAASQHWLEHAGVEFDAATPSTIAGRGNTLIAKLDLQETTQNPQRLLKIPAQLILSTETIRQHALFDRDFRELSESLGDFGKVGDMRSRPITIMFVLPDFRDVLTTA